jgi:hypothetical protein
MSAPLLAIQAALVAHLNGDAGLVALLGGPRVFAQAPAATVAPWIAVEDARRRDYGVSGPAAHEHRLALVCVSREPGAKQALELAERVAVASEAAALAPEGARLVSIAATSIETLRPGRDGLRRARVVLRAVTETL